MSNNQRWAVYTHPEAAKKIEAFNEQFPVFGPRIIALYDNRLHNDALSGGLLCHTSPTVEIRYFYERQCCDEGGIICYLVYELASLTAKIIFFEWEIQ